jgi:hypothetical protein
MAAYYSINEADTARINDATTTMTIALRAAKSPHAIGDLAPMVTDFAASANE